MMGTRMKTEVVCSGVAWVVEEPGASRKGSLEDCNVASPGLLRPPLSRLPEKRIPRFLCS